MTDKIVQLVDKDNNNLFPVAGSVDPSALVQTVGTTTGTNQNYAIKFADGTMIACIKKTFSGISFAEWRNIFEHEFSNDWWGNWAVPFIAAPATTYSCEGAHTYWIANKAGRSATVNNPASVDLCRADYATNSSGTLTAVGIGRWK